MRANRRTKSKGMRNGTKSKGMRNGTKSKGMSNRTKSKGMRNRTKSKGMRKTGQNLCVLAQVRGQSFSDVDGTITRSDVMGHVMPK